MPAEPATPPPVLAGRYALGPRLGSGGMGEVREGTDLRLHRPVAVKLLRPELSADPTARTRFAEEARAAARLNHPHVVGVYDSGEDGGTAFLVMERLSGSSLADEVANGPLPPDRARQVVLPVLAALQAAHNAGVLHRDLKPANVLLSDDGTPKVADFGIAKTAESGDLTSTGMVIGTPAYLAPERRLGAAATPASDVYAAGVLLRELLTGSGQHERPIEDPALADVVARATDPDPGRRFSSAADMAAALRGAPPDGAGAATISAPGATDRTQAYRTEAVPARAAASERRRWPLLLLLVGAIVALVWLLGTRDGDGGPQPTTPVSDLPDDLDQRLRELEEVVRP